MCRYKIVAQGWRLICSELCGGMLLSTSHLYTGLLQIRALVCYSLLVGMKDALQVLLCTHISLRLE